MWIFGQICKRGCLVLLIILALVFQGYVEFQEGGQSR